MPPPPLELDPLTSESLTAIRNLSAHKPPPEPCPNDVPAFRRAAVLLGLFGSRKGELYVILSQRSTQLRSHSGDTAIPGGRFEIGDADLEATARREAWEETGLPIDPKRAVRLCELKPFLSANELVVTPIVVLLVDPMIKVSEGEGARLDGLVCKYLRSISSLQFWPPFFAAITESTRSRPAVFTPTESIPATPSFARIAPVTATGPSRVCATRRRAMVGGVDAVRLAYLSRRRVVRFAYQEAHVLGSAQSREGSDEVSGRASAAGDGDGDEMRV